MATNQAPTEKGIHGEPVQLNLYEAKTQLSSLVDRAARGEEFVIAKAGKPMARLIPMPVEEKAAKRLPFGQNLLGIEFLSHDWEEDLPPEWFEGGDEDKLLFGENTK
jgi:prevent-host-death family protein